MELWKLPRVLVVHLKRFSFTNRSVCRSLHLYMRIPMFLIVSAPLIFPQRDKITTLVDFPLEGLDLTEYNLSKEGSAIYDLFAVSVRPFIRVNQALFLEPVYVDTGNCRAFPTSSLYPQNHYGGLGGGHYTAYCKLDGKWYDFDDSSVTAIPAERVRSSAAYVLFYLRRDADESGTKADSMQEDVKSE